MRFLWVCVGILRYPPHGVFGRLGGGGVALGAPPFPGPGLFFGSDLGPGFLPEFDDLRLSAILCCYLVGFEGGGGVELPIPFVDGFGGGGGGYFGGVLFAIVKFLVLELPAGKEEVLVSSVLCLLEPVFAV